MSHEPNRNGVPYDMSPYAFISVTGREARFVGVERAAWGTSKVDIVLEAEDPSDVPFLDSLRSFGSHVYMAYRTDVAICKVLEGTRITGRSGTQQWEISFKIETSDFTPSSEMSFSGMSADQLAEKRARRLLLNQDPFEEQRTSNINKLTEEIFIRGQGTVLAVLRSPFPGLFKQYGGNTDRFLGFAWIHAVFQLKLSACVAEVVHLKMTPRGESLDIDFLGRRKQAYANAPAYVVAVHGACYLGAR